MPTAPSSRSAQIEVRVAGVRAARRSPTRRRRRARACSASRARPAGRARAPRCVAIVTPAAIDSTSVSAPSALERGLERRRDVGRLHRDDHDVGVGDRPRRARHDAHLGNCCFELARGGRRRPRRPRASSASKPASSRPPTSAAPIFRRRGARCGHRGEANGGVSSWRARERRTREGPRNLRAGPALPRTERPSRTSGPLEPIARRSTVPTPYATITRRTRRFLSVFRGPYRKRDAGSRPGTTARRARRARR